MIGEEARTKASAHASFQLMAATERDTAEACAALARKDGDGDPAHWDRLAQVWQTAINVMEKYHTDPLFAGRIDGALWDRQPHNAGSEATR